MAQRAEYAVKLSRVWEEVNSLTARLDDSAGKLATVTNALVTSTEKNGQQDQELTKFRAELVAAQAWADEGAALAAKAQVELRTQREEAVTWSMTIQAELVSRSGSGVWWFKGGGSESGSGVF